MIINTRTSWVIGDNANSLIHSIRQRLCHWMIAMRVFRVIPFHIGKIKNDLPTWNISLKAPSRVVHRTSMSANSKTATCISKFNLFQDTLKKPFSILSFSGKKNSLKMSGRNVKIQVSHYDAFYSSHITHYRRSETSSYNVLRNTTIKWTELLFWIVIRLSD